MIAATRALVTGGNGFVGRHLVAELAARGYEVVVAGRAHEGGKVDAALDLADARNVRSVVEGAFEKSNGGIIFHLAAQAFVPAATARPMETYDTNVMGTARLIDAVRELPERLRPRLLFVGSAEVYGNHDPTDLPLRESAELRPGTPYAASKAAGEAIVLASARTYGVRVLATRAFNHIGPGQDDRFAAARFAKRLAEIAAGGDALFTVGNLESKRDFLDVRDVVRAYADLAERGREGEVYNVCSGIATPMAEVLRTLVTIARIGVEIREDAALLRPFDVALVFGDNAKLVADTGWQPKYTLARSLRDVYDAARQRVAAS